MALKMSTALRNRRANQLKLEIAGGIMELRTGGQPASTVSANSGTLLCEISIPAECLTEAVSGVVSMAGDWSGIGAFAAGSGTAPGHFRIRSAAGIVQMDGTVSGPDGSGMAKLSVDTIAANMTIEVLSFSYTEGNG